MSNRGHLYGFNPFHGSGVRRISIRLHGRDRCNLVVAYFLHRLSRAICAICIAMVFIRQFGANYHIVRDLIAGGFPGFCWLITVLWNAAARPLSRFKFANGDPLHSRRGALHVDPVP